MKKAMAFLVVLTMMVSVFGAGAMAQAAQGSYTGSAMGNNGTVAATVTLEDGKIVAITSEHMETAGLGDVAIDKLIDQIVKNQSLAVDAVSGATNSSNALLNAVTAALEAAGASIQDYMGEIASSSEPAADIDCQVVIVGAGGAGMVAALQAVENGAQSVVLLEKMGATGGNTVRSTGGMNAAATPEQAELAFTEGAGVEKTLESAKAGYGEALSQLIATVEKQYADYQANPQGYFDSVELFELDTLVGGKNINDRQLVNTLAERAADGIAWLHTIGAELTSVGSFGGASVKRIHRPVNAEGKTLSVGSYLVPIFTQKCQECDKITLLFDTRATQIVMENGAASGVVAEGPGGSFTVTADAVVLATGGFGANLEMVAGYKPELADFVTTNAPGATGDGIAMAEAVGAATVDMGEIQIHPTVEQATSALITEGLRGDGAILVNQQGQRFIDEVGTRDVVSAAEIAQSGSYAYLIIDQKMVDASSVIAGYISKGYTTEGDSYEALAQALDMDEAAFAQTMIEWNAAVAAGKDEAFGRTSFAQPLDTAPYYAIKIAPGVHHTMGGIKIDTQAQVINAEGGVIPGLFAAGEVTGGVHGANRLGGNAVADIVVFGRIAGASAAAFAAGEQEAAA